MPGKSEKEHFHCKGLSLVRVFAHRRHAHSPDMDQRLTPVRAEPEQCECGSARDRCTHILMAWVGVETKIQDGGGLWLSLYMSS